MDLLKSVPERVKIVGTMIFGVADEKTKNQVNLIDGSAVNAKK